MDCKAVSYGKGVWNVAPGMSAAYLVIGEDSALLIDAGAEDVDIKTVIRTITDLPISLVISHHHEDHLGGAGYFESLYTHPNSMPLMKNLNVPMIPVTEGYQFNLGGRILEVLEIQGHTEGSIALVDRANRMIFSGDTISDNPVFMIEGDSDINKYISSLNKLLLLSEEIDVLFCCHGTNMQDISIVEKQKKTAIDFAAGKLKPELQEKPLKAELFLNSEGIGFIHPLK